LNELIMNGLIAFCGIWLCSKRVLQMGCGCTSKCA